MGKSKELQERSDFEKLLKKCSRGDSKAQEHLFKLYFSYSMSVALRFSSCREDALEIVNDSFLKIFLKIEFHNSDSEFRAWLRRIVINTAIDRYRKDKKHNYETSIDEASGETVDESVIDNLNAEEIINLINSLPAMYRYTFTLFEIEGFSHDEISAQLGITPGTSRSNLTRAKKLLRRMIIIEHSYARVI